MVQACSTLNLPSAHACAAGGAGHSLASTQALTAQQECGAFFTFAGLAVGVLLPLWLLVKTEPASSLARWDAARQAAGHPHAASQAPLHSRAVTSFEAAVRALCGRSWLSSREQQQQGWQLEGWQRALMWWQVLSLAWLCSIALAGA